MNYSERDLGIRAGTQPPGNSPHIVAEALRNQGVIPDELLPFSNEITSVEDFYSYKGGDKNKCDAAAKQWLKNYTFGHDWVFDDASNLKQNQELMKKALQYSPLGVAVFAWYQEPVTGYYISVGPANHWVTLYGYEENKYWKIFDSYDSTHKQLHWDFPFAMAKRYTIQRQAPKQSFWDIIKKLLRIK